MNHHTHATTDRIDRRRTYRRLLYGSLFAGVALALALRFFGYPILGEAVYLAAFVVAMGIWIGSPMTLFDERDKALERAASAWTLSLFAFVLIAGASAARLVTYLDVYDVPPELWGALYGYVALFLVFGATYLWIRYRP